MTIRVAPALAAIALTLCSGFAATAAAAQAAAKSPAAASDTPSVLREISIEQGINESMAQRKLLVLVIAGNKGAAQKAADLWANPSLSRWAAAHAVVVKVATPDDLKFLTDLDANPGPNEDPVVFKDGKQLRLFGAGLPQRKSRLTNPKSEPALGLLLKLDWTLRGESLKDESWITVHTQPPAASAAQPKLIDKALLATIFTARATLADSAAKPEAIGAAISSLCKAFLTRDDPAFAPARWTVIASELAAQAAIPDRKVQVIDALRTVRSAILADTAHPWYRDTSSWLDLVAVSRAIGDHEELLRFIDDALNDPDAGATMPKVDSFAYLAALPQAHWLAPSQSKLAGQLTKVVARLDAAKPKSLTEAQWASMQARRCIVVRLQLARSYALCLRDGRTADASAVAALAQATDLPASKDGVTQLAMAIAAMVAGQTADHTVDLLKSAGKLGQTRPEFIELATAMAAPAATKPADAKPADPKPSEPK